MLIRKYHKFLAMLNLRMANLHSKMKKVNFTILFNICSLQQQNIHIITVVSILKVVLILVLLNVVLILVLLKVVLILVVLKVVLILVVLKVVLILVVLNVVLILAVLKLLANIKGFCTIYFAYLISCI